MNEKSQSSGSESLNNKMDGRDKFLNPEDLRKNNYQNKNIMGIESGTGNFSNFDPYNSTPEALQNSVFQ
jgi:hypothetical protein